MQGRRLVAAGLATVAVLTTGSSVGGAGRDRGDHLVDVQLLALNDLHGHLEPTTPGTVAGRPAGGVAYLATHVRRLAARRPEPLLVAAGDLAGGSPLVSALFGDRPTMDALSRLGLTATALGNHELDRGMARLRELQDRARFPFLSANLVDRRTRRPVLAPSVVRDVQGVRVGLIGATVRSTRELVPAAGIAGLAFIDEAAAINREVAVLRRRGVRAIVVLLHEGARQQDHDVNGCEAPRGPALGIVRRTARDVDAFVTGHTHDAYVCVIDGRLVTSAGSHGRVLTELRLGVDRRSGEVRHAVARNHVVTQEVPPAQDLEALVDRYGALAAPAAERPVGVLAQPADRTRVATGESEAGALLADAFLSATRPAGAVASFVNPGGVRTSLPAGQLTYGEAYAMLPLERRLVTLTFTGALLRAALRRQWCGRDEPLVLSPSASLTYTYDPAVARAITGRPCRGAADPVRDLTVLGEPVTPTGRYRVTVTDDIADGRDRFESFRRGTDRTPGGSELVALEEHLRTGQAVPAPDRITARRSP